MSEDISLITQNRINNLEETFSNIDTNIDTLNVNVSNVNTNLNNQVTIINNSLTDINSDVGELRTLINTLNNILTNSDYVVEYKLATSSSPSWYRVYKSGWVEQGGQFTKTGGQYASQVIKLPKSMANVYYYADCNWATSGGDTTVNFSIQARETSQVTFRAQWASSGNNCIWYVCGQGA